MAGEALGELAMIAVNDETLEELGNKMDKVTERFSYFRIVVLPLFLIGWGIYFLWFN